MKKALPLFLFFSLCMMLSCKQDDFEPESHEHAKTESKQISFREFLEQKGNNPKVQKIQKYFLGTQTVISSKNGDSLNWEIDTTYITQIITPEMTTYTFRVIEHGTISGFRNVFIKDYQNEMKAYLVHYPEGVDFENRTDATVIVEELEEGIMKGMAQCYGLRFQCLQCGMTFCNVEPGWVLISQPCSDNGGGSGGGGYYPGDPYDGPGGPIDPGDSPWSGGGGSSNGNNEPTPCDKLNQKLAADSNFKNKIIELKGKVSSSYEHGYVNHNPKENPNINSNQTNQYTPTTSNQSGHTSSSSTIHRNSIFGYMHTHPNRDNVMGVPSLQDVREYMTILKYRHGMNFPTNDTYGIIVGNHGVYALKIESSNNFGNNYNFMSPGELRKFWIDFEKKYDEIKPEGNENNTRQNNERAILNMLIDNFNVLGVSLYRAKDDLTGWNKLSLNESGNPIEVPCN